MAARSSSLHPVLHPSRPVLVALLVALLAACNLHLAASTQDSKAPGLKTGGQAACPVNQASWKLTGCVGGIVDQDSDSDDEDDDDDDKSKSRSRSTKEDSDDDDDNDDDDGDDNKSKNLLYQFYSGMGTKVRSAADCKALCVSWPKINGKTLASLNGKSDKCAYWSWNGNSDCFLYGCGVCKSATSFSASARYQNKEYISGAGPAADTCPGSGVKGDPHFTGGDQSHFDFTGLPGQTYCLISDSHLHINAYYGGRYANAAAQGKPLTWIRRVGLLWGHHTLQFVARHGAEWAYNGGYMARMEMDGQEVKLSQAGDSLSLADGSIQLKWLSAGERSGDDEVDVYAVSIRGVASLRLTLRPEVAALRTPQDGVVHINLDFEALDLSDTAHGVLGQTYRKDHKDRLAKQRLEFNDVLQVHMVKGQNAEGFLDGSVKDYVSSDLVTADCAVSRFARLSALDSETSHAMEFNAGSVVSSSSAAGLPRKVLAVA